MKDAIVGDDIVGGHISIVDVLVSAKTRTLLLPFFPPHNPDLSCGIFRNLRRKRFSILWTGWFLHISIFLEPIYATAQSAGEK